MGGRVGKGPAVPGALTPRQASVALTVWNDVMAAVQELPTNDLSGVIPARSLLLCMEA